MLNIQIQCCGMVLLWLVIFFYTRLPRLALRTKKLFDRLLSVASLCVISDIGSVIAIFYADHLPALLVRIICKLYLVLLMMLIFAGYTYLCADIFPDRRTFGKVTRISGVCFVVLIGGSLFLPIYYTCENNGSNIYSYGPYTTAVYGIYGLIYILMLVLLCRGRRTMQPRRKMAVRIWLGIWLAAAYIQLVNSSVLVVTFAGCLGVLIIYLMIENPEICLDRASGFFQTNVLVPFMTEVLGDGGELYMIKTDFHAKHVPFYEQIPGATIFVGSGEIHLLFRTKDAFDEALAQISGHLDNLPLFVCDCGRAPEGPLKLLGYVKEAQQFIRRDHPDNIYVVDEEVKAQLDERKKTERLIKDALDNDRIEPFFQPIYSIQDGCFCSAEALARIRGEDGEIIAPWRFIPVAEEDGSIVEIGKKIFEKVCSFLKENDPVALGLKYVEVNLSVIQAEDKNLAGDLLSAMEKYRIRPDQINLEITESASVRGKEQLLETMTTLIDKGLSFSLDDFGTGQSNLDYMSAMPVQIVKFDRSMTQSYFVSDKTKCVMNAAVHMIQEMGLKVVIEGIETEDQFDAMKALGVNYIQGYYFSKPLPQDAFIAFLTQSNKISSTVTKV